MTRLSSTLVLIAAAALLCSLDLRAAPPAIAPPITPAPAAPSYRAPIPDASPGIVPNPTSAPAPPPGTPDPVLREFHAAAATPAYKITRGPGLGGGVGFGRHLAPGPFQPTWDSLKQYQAPDWFRDAKFGIWAHWTAQCVPEQGDWYARFLYMQGGQTAKYHNEHFGPPSQFGTKDFDNAWHAEHWDPEQLIALYKKAGAHYFIALANHHDNFDCYDSKYQEWNSVRVGPHKDIVGGWAAAARNAGLYFGVSNHSSRAWQWLQVAYGYDAEGPNAGIPYDGFLTKADGKGTWWEGLDPQELYTGIRMPTPPGFTGAVEARKWRDAADREWSRNPPSYDDPYVNKWFLRAQDLVNKYHPDLLYFDDTELPLGQAGLDIAAHFYNANLRDHGGKLNAVLTSKGLRPNHQGTMVLDIERGRSDKLQDLPWQTDTCIGEWQYHKGIKYKSATTVITMLADIVSKNGNLMLSVPLRPDGTHDDDELQFLADMAAWMSINQEAIFNTRPWKIYGEGPPDVQGNANFNEKASHPYTAQDLRFTTKGNVLYAIALAWPTDGKVVIKSLAADPAQIQQVELLGAGPVPFTRDPQGLTIQTPDKKPCDSAYVFKITRQAP